MARFYTRTGKIVNIDICKIIDELREVNRFETDESRRLIVFYYKYNLAIDSFIRLCEFIIGDPIVLKKESKAYSITAQKQLLPYRGLYGEGFVLIEPKHSGHKATIYYYCFNRDWIEEARKEWMQNADENE